MAKETAQKTTKKTGKTQTSLSWRSAISEFTADLKEVNIEFRQTGQIFFFIIIPLLIGVFFAPYVVSQPAVGVIRLNTDIWSLSADFLLLQIDAARKDPSVKAVVLQLDSPGGTVSATQVMYLEVLSLRQDVPVITSIDSVAASGGFYLAMATDTIYAKPNSVVANIGVWGYAPPDMGVNDVIIASGPFKLTASNKTEFLRTIESIKQEFIKTVVMSRGDKLIISPEDISQGLIYSGRRAADFGLIDHLGSKNDAIQAAAQQAGIANYKVIDLYNRVIQDLINEEIFLNSPWIGAADPMTGFRILPPGAYLLYDPQLGGTP